MSRTNVVVDDELLARVMRLYNLRTKREAIDFALRKVAGRRAAHEGLLKLHGSGWEGDLDELREHRAQTE